MILIALILLGIGYVAFFVSCLYTMIMKTDDAVFIPILLSFIPVFHMVYVIWVNSSEIKTTFRKIFTK